ncbi:MAG: universal stress protein, partial [Acidobacteriia bacterium]|nr:universal stress protein [Terriglobia bacterium]
MFSLKKILLPVDFSERSLGAARYAEALAEQHGSEITMLYVLPTPHYEFTALEGGGMMLGEYYGKQKEAVRKELDQFLKAELPRLKATRLMVEGDPAGRIISQANEGVDLIVMPTHGYGPFRRFVLGSVTAKVLHDAHCPVWTGAHLETAPAVDNIQFKTVMVAVDLGPESEKTLCWANAFAARHKAKLILAHATPSLEGHTGEYFDPDWRHYLAAQATERLASLQAKAGTNAEVAIEAGDAHYVVCDLATSHKADVLVIGRGSVAGLFGRLRASAYAIIRQSPCPV